MKKGLKITILIASILVVLAGISVSLVLILNSKNKNNTNSHEQKIIYQEDSSGIVNPNLTIPYDSIDLIIGDELFLNPSYTKLDGFSLYYSSSNPNVTVNSLGVIKGIKPGSSTITVSYNNSLIEYSKSVDVNVSFGDYIPIIKLSSNESITLESGDRYNLNPYIEYRNTRYNDGKFVYESLDESVCTVDNKGVISAKEKGSAKIVISANFKGKSSSTYSTLTTYLDIEVIDSVIFLNGNDVMKDITLYTIDSINGETYPTSYDYNFKALVNGVTEDVNHEIIDSSIISDNNSSIEAITAGETQIRLYKEVSGKTYSSTYNLKVIRPVVTIDEVVPMFSIEDGKYYDSSTMSKKDISSFINDDSIILSAKQGDNDLVVTNNKIYGVVSSTPLKRGSANITILTEKIEYRLTLETLTKVISTKEDLLFFEIDDEDINGYIELALNIDATGITINHKSSLYYFTGTFNGSGHTISNLDLSNSSLFGSLYTSAKLMNFALKNLNASNANYFANKNCNNSIIVQDVFISLSEDTINPRGMFVTSQSNNEIKNVVIEYLGLNANKAPDYSLGGYVNQSLVTSNQYYASGLNPHTRTDNWENVICISPYALGFRAYEEALKNSTGDLTRYAVYYFGVNETTDFYNNLISNGMNTRALESVNCDSETYFDVIYDTVYHYKTYEELKNASYDYSKFNSKYWTINDGIISWKN